MSLKHEPSSELLHISATAGTGDGDVSRRARDGHTNRPRRAPPRFHLAGPGTPRSASRRLTDRFHSNCVDGFGRFIQVFPRSVRGVGPLSLSLSLSLSLTVHICMGIDCRSRHVDETELCEEELVLDFIWQCQVLYLPRTPCHFGESGLLPAWRHVDF